MPLNLGPKINTPHDEDAPFLHSDGTTLFFMGNGHKTMALIRLLQGRTVGTWT
ncbi:MAG: PD40 domain-containing protein [Flavobacteriales bacterium]|nr:PD40 domain-containing protein [Flavobacteriales bacterium]